MNFRTSFSKTLLIIYGLTIILWILFVCTTKYTGTLEGWEFEYLLKPFLVGMAVLPLVGGIIGIKNGVLWGGAGSVMGRGIIALSLGLITWACGMIIWNYYLFFTTIEVPYPSLADAVFILSWPLWIYGLIQISKVVGLKFGLRKTSGKKALFFISGIVILISIYLLFGVARDWQVSWDGGALKLFFDLFYPIGSIILVTLVTLIYWISKNFLGGIYKFPIIILFCGFLLNYISDFTFSLTTTKEVYFNGHFVDLLFTTAMFVISSSVALIKPVSINKE